MWLGVWWRWVNDAQRSARGRMSIAWLGRLSIFDTKPLQLASLFEVHDTLLFIHVIFPAGLCLLPHCQGDFRVRGTVAEYVSIVCHRLAPMPKGLAYEQAA